MGYSVTCDEPSIRNHVRSAMRGLTLNDARTLACRMLSEGAKGVVIRDTLGHKIAGDELAACCRGEKLLTFALQAIDSG